MQKGEKEHMTGHTCCARPFKQRRSGRERRRVIDPRYRNPQYPELHDRRKGRRRKPEYEVRYSLVKEHPSNIWITVIGLATAFFLVYASLLTNIGLSSRLLDNKKFQMGHHLELPYVMHHRF
jgi:hypothetical protein